MMWLFTKIISVKLRFFLRRIAAIKRSLFDISDAAIDMVYCFNNLVTSFSISAISVGFNPSYTFVTSPFLLTTAIN